MHYDPKLKFKSKNILLFCFTAFSLNSLSERNVINILFKWQIKMECASEPICQL